MQLHVTEYAVSEPNSLSDKNKSDQPIVILHGLFGSSRNWHPIARALSATHTVYVLDLRNHGKSPHDDVMDYPAMAQDVLEFIERYNLHSVNIIAHSMGGKAAMWLALTKPDLVQKLVVVDIAPVSYTHDFSEVLKAFQSIPLQIIKSRRDADRYLSESITQSSLRQFLLQNLQLKEGRYCWRLNLDALERSMSAITGFPNSTGIKPFDRRVLFVGGGRSDYLNKDNQALTKQLFPLASFSVIKSAGHWLHSEQPELFKSLIEPYIN